MAFVLICLICIVSLQVFLSRRKSRWPGLVLPALSFLFSLLTSVATALFSFVPPQQTFLESATIPFLLPFFLCNIPTLVLLAIYFICRGKYNRKKQLNKMNIQDLDG